MYDYVPQEEIERFNYVHHAGDYIRFKLLYEKGGTFVDMDVFCISDDIPDGEFYVCYEHDDVVTYGCLRFPRGHEIPLLMSRKCKFKNERYGASIGFLNYLLNIKKNIVPHESYELFVQPWQQANELYDGTTKMEDIKGWGVHFWNFCKETHQFTPTPDSVYSKLILS